MEVYLVRHGRTDGNDARRHQHSDTKLNEIGNIQAKAVAEKIKLLKPTHLITSTNLRAVQSASYISLVCDLIPETHLAFEELHQPKYLVGERMLGKRGFKYIVSWFYGSKTRLMHDGETYLEFWDRLGRAKNYLEQLPADARVVIVSHSVFISFFREYIKSSKKMSFVRAFRLFVSVLGLRNSSIVHLQYDTNAKAGRHSGWKLVKNLS
jgi:broad specificity phosphatase PhoE